MLDKDRFYKKVTVVASVVCIVFLGLAAVEETFQSEWKRYQAQFKDLLRANASTDVERRAAEEFNVEIRQVLLPQLGRVDRCVSCHNGIDNPAMADAPKPHRAHSGDYLTSHPVDKFGCTVCHGGQDRALSMKQAFARSESVHWDYPVLPLTHAQSSCGKCHLPVYDAGTTLAGAERLVNGRELFLANGCIGCHKTRGVGGGVGPELTNQGAKIGHAYSFEDVRGERTVENWLRQHFLDPQAVVPESLMPKVDLSGGDLNDLVTFTMSLYQPHMPTDYYALDYIEEFKGGREPLTARDTYARACAVCHGETAQGRDFATMERFTPALNSEEFLSSASDQFLWYTIRNGRTDRYMPAWSERTGGLSDQEIGDLVTMIRGFEPKPPTLAEVRRATPSRRTGEVLYRTRCSGCHGADGEGGIGPALNNQDFLAIADREFLYRSIVEGRSNTAMLSHKWLKAEWLASVLDFVEDWREVPLEKLSDTPIDGDVDNGRALFQGVCAGCHGPNGEGAVGTALMNPEFLSAASDAFIRESMWRGREHRAMRPLSRGGGSVVELSNREIDDVVAYIRSTEGMPRDAVPSRILSGTVTTGEELYQGLCAGCHGVNGEGGVGTALNNQDFLKVASNGFIEAAIVRGRTGTPMRAWGRGTAGLQELTGEQIDDLTVFIRSWQNPGPDSSQVVEQLARR